MHFSQAPAKGDISTLPAGGHFYFALTDCGISLTTLDKYTCLQSLNLKQTALLNGSAICYIAISIRGRGAFDGHFSTAFCTRIVENQGNPQ